jgi:hypothetical protein
MHTHLFFCVLVLNSFSDPIQLASLVALLLDCARLLLGKLVYRVPIEKYPAIQTNLTATGSVCGWGEDTCTNN